VPDRVPVCVISNEDIPSTGRVSTVAQTGGIPTAEPASGWSGLSKQDYGPILVVPRPAQILPE